MKFRWTLLICIPLLISCGKEIPEEIIQPDKMERVLYDYHLMMSLPDNGKNSEKEAGKNYIFHKHSITQADFDSSMVWYTRESKELMTIYEKLNKRFKREYDQTARLLENREEANTRSFVSGDTVDVWVKEKLLWFTKNPLNNRLAFEIKADTTFHQNDAFLWDMEYSFFAEGEVIMGLNVVSENDSVIGMTKTITQSGHQSICLQTDSTFKIQTLNGFIFVPEKQGNQPNVLIHNISLTRNHMTEYADSLSMDNIQTETKDDSKAIPQPQKDRQHLKRPKNDRILNIEESKK